MISVSDDEFEQMLSSAINSIKQPYIDRLQNVAFLVEDNPSPQQAQQLGLRCNDLLFGLYEGVPLPQRGGRTKLLPYKITLFKKPLELVSQNKQDLAERVRHTIWHEVAHYYGLDHKKIHELEQ